MEQIIAIDGIARLTANLEKYIRNATDTLPVNEEIAVDMLRVEGIIFSSNGRRGGGSWRALKESTKARKGNDQILRTAGSNLGYSYPGHDALYRSVTKLGAEYQILHIGNREIQFGTKVPGAGYTQRSRPFLKFTQQDWNRWGRMIADHLVRTV